MITPDFLKSEMAKKSAKAYISIDCEDGPGAVLITSKINGIAGNQISVAIEYDDLPGPPTCTVNGLAITYRIPNVEAFEASGPFFYDGGPALNYLDLPAFLGLWYAGDFNGKKSWSLTGDPDEIEWPITANGEYMLFAEGAWHMIMRVGGDELMHWQADFDTENIIAIPRGAYGPENLGGWRGIAPLCTGWLDPHYSAPINEAQYLSFITEGSEILPFLPGNPVVLALLDITVPNGADENKLIIPTTRRNLDGGK